MDHHKKISLVYCCGGRQTIPRLTISGVSSRGGLSSIVSGDTEEAIIGKQDSSHSNMILY